MHHKEDTTVNDILTSFILVENINSFQKLRFLLFLHEHFLFAGTPQDFAQQLHLGDPCLLEQILADLEEAELLIRVGERYHLTEDSATRHYLQCLATAFADPLTRQEILEQVQRITPLTFIARRVLKQYEH